MTITATSPSRPPGFRPQGPGVVRRTARLAWLWLLIAGIALFEGVRQALIDTQNPNFLPSLLLLGAVVVPASFVTFIYQRRLPYDVSAGTLVAVAFFGGIVGGITAGVLEYSTLRRLGTLPMVAVGVIEELSKLLAPLAVLLLTRHRRPADGLLVGVASGAGFAVLETMGYAFVVLIQSQGNLQAVQGLLLIRGVLSPAAHMTWTGLTAAALWQAAAQHWRAPAVLRFVAVFAVAAGLHTAWDSLHGTTSYVVLSVISLSLLLYTAHRLHVAAHRAAADAFPLEPTSAAWRRHAEAEAADRA